MRFHFTFFLITLVFLPISIAQWLVIRREQPGSGLWIVTTPIALLLWSSVLRIIPPSVWGFVDDESPVVLVLLYSVFATLLGIFQWMILNRDYSQAWIWIAGNALSLGIGAALFMALGPGTCSAIILAGFYVIGTGICLHHLHPRSAKVVGRLHSA